MAEGKEFPESPSPEETQPDSGASPQTRPTLTRRDFLIKTNAGAVAVGMATGAGFAATLVQQPSAPPKAAAPPKATLTPVKTRRVALNIDGKRYDVDVDVRESLWETMNYQLGLSNANLGCDRAQCGACAVVVDGRAVNSCTLLSARYGRGQKIVTVAGIASGPGPQGLHPLQRAFWLDGGFQCGICTRGFIMTAYALLQVNKNPSEEQIKEALSGNICRCGEYVKIISAVKKAAAEMRGEKVTYTAPLVAAEVLVTSAAPAGGTASKQFEFVTALGTIELYDEVAVELKQKPGIVGVSGSERTVTPIWDPTKLDEARVRQILAEMGHPVKP
jgi:aerobic-type carbon monoxide dehydrogenase small subunit (CoxS/CutS family)